MNRNEAAQLEHLIKLEAPTLHVTMQQIGNGEWVCVVGSIWIWDEEDWEKCKSHPDIQEKCLIASGVFDGNLR